MVVKPPLKCSLQAEKKIIGIANKLPGNGTRYYQVISILGGTKSILSTHLCSEG
jgi:hypothetical protein